MAQRSRLFVYAASFAVPFLVAAGAVRSTGTKARVSTLAVAVETTAAIDTIPVDTTPDTTVASTDPLTVDTIDVGLSVAETSAPTRPPRTTTIPAPTDPPRPKLPAPPLDADGALLRPLADEDRRLVDPAVDSCGWMARPQATFRSCGMNRVGELDVGWVSMAEGFDVLARSDTDGPDIWTVVLRSNAPVSRDPLFIDSSGGASLLVGWRSGDRTLAVDVVEFAGGLAEVTLHLSMLDGRVSPTGSGLEAWSGVVSPGGDPSQPTSYVHWTYRKSGGNWRASTDEVVSPPRGEL